MIPTIMKRGSYLLLGSPGVGVLEFNMGLIKNCLDKDRIVVLINIDQSVETNLKMMEDFGIRTGDLLGKRLFFIDYYSSLQHEQQKVAKAKLEGVVTTGDLESVILYISDIYNKVNKDVAVFVFSLTTLFLYYQTNVIIKFFQLNGARITSDFGMMITTVHEGVHEPKVMNNLMAVADGTIELRFDENMNRMMRMNNISCDATFTKWMPFSITDQGEEHQVVIGAKTEPEKIAPTPVERPSSKISGVQKNRILIVDDQEIILELTKEYLGNLMGAKVDGCMTGQEALQKMTETRYDAIVSDYKMPSMNGLELLTKAREIDNNIPFIIFTGKGREEVVIESVNKGADFYVSKGGEAAPQFMELANAIKQAIARRENEQLKSDTMERYRSLRESMSDILCILDFNSVVIDINDAALRLLGYTKEDLVGINIRTILAPDLHEQNRQEMQNMIKTGAQMGLKEYRFRRKDDSWMDADVSGSVIRRGGIPYAIQLVARDVSERKQSLERLREQERKFHLVADFTYDWEYWVGTDKEMIYCTPSCERMTGYTVDDFLSTPLLIEKIVHPDDKAAFVEHDKPGAIGRKFLDFRIIKRGGEVRWIQHACQSIFDENGREIGRRGSNRDVTELKKAENQLRTNEVVYRHLINNIEEGVMVVHESKVKFANKKMCSMLDSKTDLAERIFKELVVPEERDGAEELVRKVVEKDPDVKEPILRLLRNDGAAVPVSLKAMRIEWDKKMIDLLFMKEIAR